MVELELMPLQPPPRLPVPDDEFWKNWSPESVKTQFELELPANEPPQEMN